MYIYIPLNGEKLRPLIIARLTLKRTNARGGDGEPRKCPTNERGAPPLEITSGAIRVHSVLSQLFFYRCIKGSVTFPCTLLSKRFLTVEKHQEKQKCISKDGAFCCGYSGYITRAIFR